MGAEKVQYIRVAEALAAEGLIRPADALPLKPALDALPVAISPEVRLQIKASNHDPAMLKQYVPSTAETVIAPHERADPIGDVAHAPMKGIIHRYQDRVLLNLLKTCAVYCRFCFRRDFVGKGEDTLTLAETDAALDYIAADQKLWEVILSGGDPMILSPRRQSHVAARLADMDHIRILRLHTKVPLVAPERITDELINALTRSGKTIYIGLHINHPAELSPNAMDAIKRLNDAGISLISQTVLLKDVNDNSAILAELFRKLVEHRVKPYYLHHPDLVRGTGHFRVDLATGQRIVNELRGNLSGLCQPTYMLDIPGGFGKVPIGASYIKQNEDGCLMVKDIQGAWHIYNG